MDTKHWETIEKILDKALELPEDEQLAYIKYACNGKEKLQKEVASLLKAVQESKEAHFLEDNFQNKKSLIQNLAKEKVAKKFIGKRIGPFELTEKIGSGGMSIIFKAQRIDGSFKQKVAIKLIRSGLHSEEILQRFELEKQILANLTHPHIARLYDGGVTKDRNPYLIMEYVDGKTIDRYCDEKRLTIDERLSLFKQVCDAVKYAHSNLVVHRDLKAENIYVTNEGAVKVLDFGIAKLLDTNAAADNLLITQPGRQLWTPQYASPEQVNDEQITTAADIYSLGVLLHKLLTGTYPFDFKGKSITKICAAVNNEPPDSLLKSLNEQTDKKLAAKRSTSFKELKKTLRGDLEAIKAKTLRKSVGLRYKSIDKLAEDISNYQNNLPVQAKNGNTAYNLKKFGKRYKKGISFAVAVLFVIVSLTAYYTNQLSLQRQQAVRAAEKATTISTLLKNILQKSSPYGRYGKRVTLEQVLLKGTQQIRDQLKDQPLLKAEMMGLLAEIYNNLGDYNKAKSLLSKALRIQESAKNSSPGQKALNFQRLGYALFRQGYFIQSIEKYKKAENLLLGMDEPNKAKVFSFHKGIAMAYSGMGKKDRALSHYKKALNMIPEKDLTAQATLLGSMGVLYQNMNQFKKALQLLHKSLRLQKNASDIPSPNLANAYNNLAFTYQRMRNLKKADSLHQIALLMRKDILPPDHPHIASSLIRYGLVKVHQGKLREAEKMFAEAYFILKKTLPDSHWQVESAVGALALVHGLMGNLQDNIPALKRVYNNWKKQFGKDDWRTAMAYRALQILFMVKQKKVENRQL